MNIIDYCKLFRVLYNSTYLGARYSELALDLLTQSNFKKGFLRNPGFHFPVAHKFGERIFNNIEQLHEVGIFYDDGQPYLLGVMTSGDNLDNLSNALSEVSNAVYEEASTIIEPEGTE